MTERQRGRAAVTGSGRSLLLLTRTDTLAPSALRPRGRGRPGSGACVPNIPHTLYIRRASTGTPKGVVGLHRSIVNRVIWLASSAGRGRATSALPEDQPRLRRSRGGDFPGAERWRAAGDHCARRACRRRADLLRELDAQTGDAADAGAVVAEEHAGGRTRRARAMAEAPATCSGEALHSSRLAKASRVFPQARLFNIYGPRR